MSERKPVSIKTASERLKEYRNTLPPEFNSFALDMPALHAKYNAEEIAELRAALEALQETNAALENEKRIAHSWGMVLVGQNTQLKDETAAQAKRIADLTEELRLTNLLLSERERVLEAIPECEAHGQCVPHAVEWVNNSRAEIEALRKQVETYKSEREPMRQAFVSFKYFAERNRTWSGMSWRYYGYGLDKAYDSAVEMLRKLVANDLNLSAQKGTK